MRNSETENAIRVFNKLDRGTFLKSDTSPALQASGLFEGINIEEKVLKEHALFKIDGKVPVHVPFIPTGHQEVLMKKVFSAFREKENLFINSPHGVGTSHCMLAALLGGMKLEREKKVDWSLNEPSRIIFVSRTKKRMDQISSLLKQLAYRPSICHYKSKAAVCQRFQDDISSDEVESLCSESRQSKSCLFLENLKNFRYNPLEMNSVNDIEDFNEFCPKANICQFYFSLDYINLSDILFISAEDFFDRIGFQALELNIKNAILVIDDAFHLEQHVKQGHSADIDTETDLNKAEEELSNLEALLFDISQEELKEKDLDDLGSLVKSLKNQFKNHQSGKPFIERMTNIGQRNDEIEYCVFPFWRKSQADRSFADYLARMKKIIACLIKKKEVRESIGLCKLFRFIELSLFLKLESERNSYVCENYVLMFHIDKSSEKSRSMMSLRCLSPYPFFNQVEGLRTIIFRSNNLCKLHILQREYGIKIKYDHETKYADLNPFSRDSDPSSIPKIFFSFLKEPNDFAQSNVPQSNAPQSKGVAQSNGPKPNGSQNKFASLGKNVINLLIPMTGRILLLFPSAAMMHRCYLEWKNTEIGLVENLERIREVLVYSKSESPEKFLEKFQETSKIAGAVLFASTCQGIIEVLEASEKIMNGVVIIGDTKPPPRSMCFELETQKLLDERNKRRLGYEFNYSGKDWELNQSNRYLNRILGAICQRVKEKTYLVIIGHQLTHDCRFLEWLPKNKPFVFHNFSDLQKSLVTFNNWLTDTSYKSKEEAQEFFIQTFNIVRRDFKSSLEKGVKIKSPFTEEQEDSLKKLLNITINSIDHLDPVPCNQDDQSMKAKDSSQDKFYKAVLHDTEKWEVALISKPNKYNPKPEQRFDISNRIVECPICYESKAELKANKCGHVACKQCWEETLEKNPDCPLCRVRVEKSELISIFLEKMA